MISNNSTRETSKTNAVLGRISRQLTLIAARIQQLPNRKASVVTGVATSTLTSTAFYATLTGSVGALGTASTGAAIAGLSGAAKTTATLFWIGNLFLGGVATGTVVLGVGAVGAGIYGSTKVKKALHGKVRRIKDLSDHEVKILCAIGKLQVPITRAMYTDEKISQRELKSFWRIGVSPLITEVEAAIANGCFEKLTKYNRFLLRGDVNVLKKIEERL